jgi:hypothetical protein
MAMGTMAIENQTKDVAAAVAENQAQDTAEETAEEQQQYMASAVVENQKKDVAASAPGDTAQPWNKTLLARGREHVDLVTKFEGVAWPSFAVSESGSMGGETHVFVVGDWGTLLPNHLTAPNHRPRHSGNKCPEKCDYVHGVDDKAQLLVAAQMKRLAGTSNPAYVLNPGDNFYWGGITQNCGGGSTSASGKTIGEFALVWQSVYGSLTNIPWISALGNHDYGGYQFNMGWDQQIAYSHSNPNWVMPARYYSRLMHHPGYTMEYFIIDSNAMNAYPPGQDPEHNICGEKHNPPGATCAAVGGPSSLSDCYSWFWSTYRTQQAWLESKLAASSADWQVVVTHQNCFHDASWYQKLHAQHGLDLLVTGHRHAQEIHNVGKLPCIVSGGGGGVTSEGAPRGEYNSQYGFFDLTMSKEKIKIELVNFNGHVTNTATIGQKARRLSPMLHPWNVSHVV